MSFNAYNKFKSYKDLSYKIITALINDNEDIWKMLKYDTTDALSQPNLTLAEKGALIYSGEEDATLFRVFRDEFTDDAFDKRVSQLRIFPSTTIPENHLVAIQDVVIQIVIHTKINTMDDYLTRMDTFIENILGTLNGSDIGTVGTLYFDRSRGRNDVIRRGAGIGNNKNFLGAMITMSVNLASPEL